MFDFGPFFVLVRGWVVPVYDTLDQIVRLAKPTLNRDPSTASTPPLQFTHIVIFSSPPLPFSFPGILACLPHFYSATLCINTGWLPTTASRCWQPNDAFLLPVPVIHFPPFRPPYCLSCSTDTLTFPILAAVLCATNTDSTLLPHSTACSLQVVPYHRFRHPQRTPIYVPLPTIPHVTSLQQRLYILSQGTPHPVYSDSQKILMSTVV